MNRTLPLTGVILNGLQAVKDLARSGTAPAGVISAPREMLRKLSMTQGMEAEFPQSQAFANCASCSAIIALP